MSPVPGSAGQAYVDIRWAGRSESARYAVHSAKGRTVRIEATVELPAPGTAGRFALYGPDGVPIAHGELQLVSLRGSEAALQITAGEKAPPPPVPSEPPPEVEVDMEDLPLPDMPLPDMPAPGTPSVIVEGAEDSARPPSGSAARVATRIRGRGASEGIAIGIDLGTSNTCASIVKDGKPQVLTTRWGTTTIPSVLAILDGQVKVGPDAAKRLVLNPEETVYGSKRLIGRAYSDELADEFQPYFAYPLVETEDHQFGAGLPERVISFEEVAERLLFEVRKLAQESLGKPVDQAVITVPAYFGEAQRDAVRRAGRAAGLRVGRVVNEPTAAAVAYGYDRKEQATLVVFDLGGGTFDVSILKVEDNRFEVLGTGGDAFLGGIDVDDMLANLLLEDFVKNERLEGFEPNAQQVARLREAAEACKRGLSVQKKFAVQLPHFALEEGQARHLQVNVTQEDLDRLIDEFCARLVAITEDTLAKCGLQTYSVDDVLLVGGSTRLPQVQAAVQKLFERPPSKRINPDEAVALGAALLASKGGAVELIDVLPLSIGFAGEGRRFMRLIPRNTPVPKERSFVVRTTSEGQLTYPMPIFQGERKDAGRNEYLGTVLIEGIPAGAKGQEIELTLALDEQCFLEVRAKHLESGAPLDVKLLRQSADEVVAGLGPYEGPEDAPDRLPKKRSALGWFFARLRGLFARS